MIRLLKAFCLATIFSTPAQADGEPADEFDYYVLSLSWTPSWCELEGDARNSTQCDAGQGFGFTLHGLWPQYEAGWPSYCRTVQPDPTRSQNEAMADIMGTSGLAWYQWKKHGRCAGMSSQEYYQTAREAYTNVTRPEVLRNLPRKMSLPPAVIEAAFLELNEGIEPDGLTVTCKSGMIQEVRVCLTKELNPRICGADVIRDCQYAADMAPMR
ncbi:ribonuclease T [Rhodobacterales bacterium 52_120_T64]|nr:ribonuclease T [Rhodobacterales bacterium 52_120_T64]